MANKDFKGKFDKNFVNSDDWYTWKGVTPPSHELHNITEEELREKTKEIVSNHKCHWIQRGQDISCDAGDFVHGRRIPIGKILSGQDGSIPILKDIVITRQ